MKIKTAKKVIGWLLVLFGLLIIVLSPFSTYIWDTKQILLQDAAGGLICLTGIWMLIQAVRRKETSN